MSQAFEDKANSAGAGDASEVRDLTLEYMHTKTQLNEEIIRAVSNLDTNGLNTSLGSTAKFRERWDQIFKESQD